LFNYPPRITRGLAASIPPISFGVGELRHTGRMCRSIKTLRPPATPEVSNEDIQAAALQYVRKVSGFRAPAAHNRAAFERAVAAVTEATRQLLAELEVRGQRTPQR
jgi:hypothetical protein